MKKFNLLIGLSSGLILLLVILLTDGLGELINQILRLDLFWVGVAVLCMFLKWFFDSTVIHIITRFIYVKQRFIDSIKVTMIGQFFNSVTPFASGGQPAQMYVFLRDGIQVGYAGSILMVKFVIYQAVLTMYSILVIFFKFAFFKEKVRGFLYIAIISFFINIFVILAAILFSKNKRLTRRMLLVIFKILKKLRVVKDDEKAEKKFEEQLISFHKNASLVKNNTGLLIKTALLTFLQLTALYVIPYCIYRSFGLHGVKITDMIAANAFVMMVTAYVPLPGAAGGAEGGFYLFFSYFFRTQNIMAAIFIWRIITYYFNIGFGGLVAVLAPEKPLKSLHEGN